MEYWGKDTHHTGGGLEEALNRVVSKSILVEVDLIIENNVKCAQEVEELDLLAVLRSLCRMEKSLSQLKEILR